METASPQALPLPPGFASAEELLAAFIRDSGGDIGFVDGEQRVRFATERFAAGLGRPLAQVLGRTLRELYGAEVHDRIDPPLRRALAGETVRYEREVRQADGESRWISVVLAPTRDAGGRVIGVFSSALEVEELKRTHDALGQALGEIASHFENSPLAVIEWSSRLRAKRWSPQARAIFGWTLEEVLGKEAIEIGLIHPASIEIAQGLAEDLLRARARRNRALVRNLTKDGRVIWCEWFNSAFFDADGRLASILSFAEDVTARVDAEQQLQRLAVNDALTGLPNRNSLATRLEHAIRRVTRSGDRIALLFVDLDRFKRVNDTLGHAAGDEVLRQAAARIRACVRDVDTVARLGGDEFVVLLETDVRPDTPGIIGERVRAAFATPFDWKGTAVRCGASAGVSLYPDHARDPAALLASADEAMYRAKREPQT